MTINPYNVGLRIGSELDVVLTDPNYEPVLAGRFLTAGKEIKNDRQTYSSKNNINYAKVRNGLVRVYSADVNCRGYALDNIWWNLKMLVVHLKKKAKLSYVPSLEYRKKIIVAGGHLRFSTQASQSIYGGNKAVRDITYGKNKGNEQLIRNLDLILGILTVMFDQRPTAELRRKEYAVGSKKHVRRSKSHLTYMIPTNWWLFSSALAHLVYGAGRMAYFVSINGLSKKLWKDINYDDVANAINDNDYDKAREIWNRFKSRFTTMGHPESSNPFTTTLCNTIDFLLEYGIGCLGTSVYKNWRMKRMRQNYHGHLADVPSWENGVPGRIFTKKHELYEEWKKRCLKKK